MTDDRKYALRHRTTGELARVEVSDDTSARLVTDGWAPVYMSDEPHGPLSVLRQDPKYYSSENQPSHGYLDIEDYFLVVMTRHVEFDQIGGVPVASSTVIEKAHIPELLAGKKVSERDRLLPSLKKRYFPGMDFDDSKGVYFAVENVGGKPEVGQLFYDELYRNTYMISAVAPLHEDWPVPPQKGDIENGWLLCLDWKFDLAPEKAPTAGNNLGLTETDIQSAIADARDFAERMQEADWPTILSERDGWDTIDSDTYSIANMSDEEVMQSIVADIVVVQGWINLGKEGVTFTKADLFRFVYAKNIARAEAAFSDPFVQSFLTQRDDGELRIEPAYLQDAIDFSGVSIEGYGFLTDDVAYRAKF